MNITLLGLALGGGAFSTSSYSSEFQYELEGSVGNIALSSGAQERDIDFFKVGGTAHFSAIDTLHRPLSEAGFLARSNNVQLIHTIYRSESDVDFDILRSEIYVPVTLLYVAPYYLYMNSKYDGSAESDNSYGFALGVTPLDGLKVSTIWNNDIDYEINLDLKYITAVSGYAINVEASYTKGKDEYFEEEDDYFGFAFDFFVDPTLSLGLEFHSMPSVSQIINGGHLYGAENTSVLNAKKYFMSSIGVSAQYSVSDDSQVDVDSFELAVSFRF